MFLNFDTHRLTINPRTRAYAFAAAYYLFIFFFFTTFSLSKANLDMFFLLSVDMGTF